MSADGFGNANGGSAVAASQLFEPSLSTPFFRCVAFFQTCGSSPDFSGVVNLPDDAEGNLTAAVNCSSSTGTSCDQNAKNNAWGLMQVRWAHLLLSIGVSPSGSGFSGSALQPGVRGTGHLLFTAGETTGPGIYSDAVAIDGRLDAHPQVKVQMARSIGQALVRGAGEDAQIVGGPLLEVNKWLDKTRVTTG